LPDAPLPPDLSWAAGNPSIAAAFGRASAAIEAAAEASVPPAVRDLLTTELAGWHGQPPGLSRSWVAEATSGLPGTQRAAGRLALLTAFAAYQVDRSVIDEFRGERLGDGAADDRALIELTAWASLRAARRVGGRMCAVQPPHWSRTSDSSVS
jgi:hypothetical protein